MAYLDVYYGRIGSYNGSIKIDESTINNTTQFSSTGFGQYTSHNFIKPVGLFQHMGNNEYNVFVFAISTNYSADCIQWYQNYSGHSISYGRIVGGFNLTTIQSQYIPNINYFNVIPWFNNIDDASNWSCGNSFNPANWVGGLDVRVQYNWQSVPSISGKNGILSLVTLNSESVNDGEPVSGAAVSVFDQNPVSGNNVKDIVDGNTPLIPSAVDVTAAFIISNPPVGELASRILAAKKGSIPESIEDADKTVSIPANASNVTMPGLDENSQYYFAIFVADATGDTAVSDPKDIYTSADEGWSFDYTGEIQTFIAPKTGIYQLETWGAQGGDATDGTLVARGGYGAYAVGEVLLNEGDTLYINVGGQNGYGGGGNGEVQYNIDDLLISTDITNYVSGGSGDMSSIKSLAEQYEGTGKVIYTYHKYSGSGDYSSPSMIYNNNKEFIYSRGNGVVTGYTGFPIRGISGMKSIEFDIVTTDTEDGTFVIALIDGNDHHAYLYSEAPYTTSGGLKHVVVDSGLSDYTYTYFVIGIQRTLTISNVKITYAT